MGHPTLHGNPYNGYVHPCQWGYNGILYDLDFGLSPFPVIVTTRMTLHVLATFYSELNLHLLLLLGRGTTKGIGLENYLFLWSPVEGLCYCWRVNNTQQPSRFCTNILQVVRPQRLNFCFSWDKSLKHTIHLSIKFCSPQDN